MTDMYFGPHHAGAGTVEPTGAWRLPFFGGLLMVVLGIVVVANPGSSLTVVSVLVGVLVLISGAVHLVQAFVTSAEHRVWSAVVGLASIVIGLLLVRHLDMTVVLLALLLGISWILQGVASLVLAGEASNGRRSWGVAFGLISLIAGIVVLAAPIGSLTVLAVLVGLSFIAIGAVQMASAWIVRGVLEQDHRTRAAHRSAGDGNVGGMDAATGAPHAGTPGPGTAPAPGATEEPAPGARPTVGSGTARRGFTVRAGSRTGPGTGTTAATGTRTDGRFDGGTPSTSTAELPR